MESIEAHTGRLADGDLSKTPEAPAANSFQFSDRHVLYGKLRPYLNKVFLPNFEGKCSTELVPLLPCKELEREYLAYFLRWPETVSAIAAKTSGARMPRADMDFVFDLPIDLPPVPEQRRIVDILTRAESIVRLQQQATDKAREIIPALFLDMFGDPATNSKGWPVVHLGEVISDGPKNGLYKPASAYGSGTPILRIDAFYDGRVNNLAFLKRLQLDPAEVENYAIRSGDIVINRVNSPEYLGKSAVIPDLSEPTVFESNMMRMTLNASHILPAFAIEALNTVHVRAQIKAKAKRAINQSSINQQDVKSLLLSLPSLTIQSCFADRAACIRSIQSQSEVTLTKAHETFQSLLHRAFSRQL